MTRRTPLEPCRQIPFEEAAKSIHLRIEDFHSKVQSYLNLNHHRSLSPKSLNHLLKICLQEKRTIEGLYPNKNTQHRYFTKYRNATLVQGLPEKISTLIRDQLKLSHADAASRSLQRDEQIHLKTNNVTLFHPGPFVRTAQKLLKRAVKASQVKGAPYPPGEICILVIGLLALTGRRPIEILKTGSFQFVDAKHVLFSGQAKTKNSPLAKNSYVIPVLDDAKVIIQALKLLRQILPLSSSQNELVSKAYAGKILRQMKILQEAVFPQEGPRLRARDLRSLYVTSAYHLFNIHQKASFNAFAARVLGHSHLDKDTANCYTYFAIKSSRKENEGKDQ